LRRKADSKNWRLIILTGILYRVLLERVSDTFHYIYQAMENPEIALPSETEEQEKYEAIFN
jgi:hypothetical protein